MDFQRWLQELAARIQEMLSGKITPVTRKVLAVTYAPRMPSSGDLPLYQAMPGWSQPDLLFQGFIDDLRSVSNGYANYVIIENVVEENFIPMKGSLRYTPEQYLATWDSRQPLIEDFADYSAILQQYQVLEKIRAGQVDEVWLMGYPFGGFRESRMGGPGAFFCNGEILENTSAAGRRFVVMGFSYERGLGEMLESMGHRAESILAQVYSSTSGEANLWERFNRIDWTHPGKAEVGSVHHGPNAILTPDRDDHQWTETRKVTSRHRTWFNFPDLSGPAEPISCTAWQQADMTRGHHLWWFQHFPHVAGQQNGIANNWWRYVIDPETV